MARPPRQNGEPASERLNITVPAPYARRIIERARDRGVCHSEALRQYMDAADSRDPSGVEKVRTSSRKIVQVSLALRRGLRLEGGTFATMLDVIEAEANKIQELVGG